VRYFLVELRVTGGGPLELDRAQRMLESAQARLSGPATVAPEFVHGRGEGGQRLACLLEADSLEAAHRLMSVALIPYGPIREISTLARRRLLGGRDPRGDVDPGLEAELVEDVVDMGLDGPLGQE
jgi:hypothetical protein